MTGRNNVNIDAIFKTVMSGDIVQLATRFAVISAFVWSIAGAVVFVIKRTRVEKILGAEFDPETDKPKTRRR